MSFYGVRKRPKVQIHGPPGTVPHSVRIPTMQNIAYNKVCSYCSTLTCLRTSGFANSQYLSPESPGAKCLCFGQPCNCKIPVNQVLRIFSWDYSSWETRLRMQQSKVLLAHLFMLVGCRISFRTTWNMAVPAGRTSTGQHQQDNINRTTSTGQHQQDNINRTTSPLRIDENYWRNQRHHYKALQASAA